MFYLKALFPEGLGHVLPEGTVPRGFEAVFYLKALFSEGMRLYFT